MEQMNTQSQDFLKNLRSLRARTGMNQTEFAKKCGINPAQYRRYENCSSVPRIETIAKIASVLGVNIEDLTGDKAVDCDILSPNHSSQINSDSAKAIKAKNIKTFDATNLVKNISEIVNNQLNKQLSDKILQDTFRKMNTKAVIDFMELLNAEGVERLLDIAMSLACNPKFRRESDNAQNTSQEDNRINTDTQKETPGE